jgi:Tat protein translocase TatC
MVQEFGHYFGLKTACFRGGCLTGPGHSGAMLHGFLSYLMKCAVTGDPYCVLGYKGKQVRDNIHSYDLVNAFWHFIQAPYCKIHFANQPYAGTGHSCALYVTGIFDAFFLQLKLAFIVGVIISSPVWLYQFWAFIAPGLYARERRWAYFFVGAAVPLFAFGGALAYFAMTRGLRFLLGLVPNHVIPLITINTYLSYATAMLFIFGLAFELPLVVVLLNLAGILTHERFAKSRRMIIFGVFAFAAIATPSRTPSRCCSRCRAWRCWSNWPRYSPGPTTAAGPGGGRRTTGCRPTRCRRSTRSAPALASMGRPGDPG